MSAQLSRSDHYVNAEQITSLAVEVYRKKCGRGITYQDLLNKGFAYRKRQAQDTLKYNIRRGTLFTLGDKRPQQYYPTAIRSEIIENKQKNTPLDPTGVALPYPLPISKNPLANCLEPIIIQTLEGYILPLLPEAPLFIHNMHFKTRVSPECYAELNLPSYNRNHGKCHTEIIGNTHVDYVFYSNGTVNVDTTCSKNPHKLETEEDRSRIIAFFGQIRDRLIILLTDRHERIVPDIMQWELTECDINKDIKISDFFHFTGIKIQVKHFDHLFRIYIKSSGQDTVCRVENQLQPHKPAIEFINDIFNPIERVEKQIEQFIETMEKRINQKLDSILNCNCNCSYTDDKHMAREYDGAKYHIDAVR